MRTAGQTEAWAGEMRRSTSAASTVSARAASADSSRRSASEETSNAANTEAREICLGGIRRRVNTPKVGNRRICTRSNGSGAFIKAYS